MAISTTIKSFDDSKIVARIDEEDVEDETMVRQRWNHNLHNNFEELMDILATINKNEGKDIPNEFQAITEFGVAVFVLNQQVNIYTRTENTPFCKVGVLLQKCYQPIVYASTYEFKNLGSNKEPVYDKIKRASFQEFRYKLLPFKKEWLPTAHNNAKDLVLLTQKDLDEKQIFDCRNIEIRRHLFKKFGMQLLRNPDTSKVKIMDRQGEEVLFRFKTNRAEETIQIAYVRDPSTKRMFPLDIPMEERAWSDAKNNKIYKIEDLHTAKAWSFGFRRSQYKPVKET